MHALPWVGSRNTDMPAIAVGMAFDVRVVGRRDGVVDNDRAVSPRRALKVQTYGRGAVHLLQCGRT